jgi:hypothetical protein
LAAVEAVESCWDEEQRKEQASVSFIVVFFSKHLACSDVPEDVSSVLSFA